MNTDVLLYAAGLIVSVFGWFLRQRIAAQEKENQRLASECERNAEQIGALQREQRDLATRQELDEYKRDTSVMFEALRSGLKADLENIRRVEIRELHEILRNETRQTRTELREDMQNLTRTLQEQIKHLARAEA